jgi:hypothetical protein
VDENTENEAKFLSLHSGTIAYMECYESTNQGKLVAIFARNHLRFQREQGRILLLDRFLRCDLDSTLHILFEE